MKILAIETSSQFTYLALCAFKDSLNRTPDKDSPTNGAWITEKFTRMQTDKKKDNWLELAIHDFCDTFALRDLDGYATGYGPGSFTGLRINFTYLKTLAILWGKFFLTFSTSRFYHSLYCKPDEALIVQLNSSLFYACDPDLPPELTETENSILSLDEWVNHYSGKPGKKIRLWRQLQSGNQPHSLTEINPEITNDAESINVNLPSPEHILKNKQELMTSLPFYGHGLNLHRKL